MDIEEQFNLIAKEYDEKRRMFIPCFDDYYENSTKTILSGIKKPTSILDLGAGTGLLTQFWYKECPNTEFLMVDIAEEMLNIAKKRFYGINNVKSMTTDYNKTLPNGNFDAVISALSIHHLDDMQKEKLFKRIYEKLPTGGIFANYDQFMADSPVINRWITAFWEKQIANSGLSDKDIELWQERRKLDKECSVAEEIAMLKKSGFENVSCIYTYHKFSVILAIK